MDPKHGFSQPMRRIWCNLCGATYVVQPMSCNLCDGTLWVGPHGWDSMRGVEDAIPRPALGSGVASCVL